LTSLCRVNRQEVQRPATTFFYYVFMPRLQVFITIGNRSYKNRLSLDGFASRHPPLCMADWRKCGGYRLWSLVVRQRSEYEGWSSETCLAQKLFIIGRLRFPYCLSASLFGQILLCPTLQKGDCFCLQLPPIAFKCHQLPFSFFVSRSTLHVSRYSLQRPSLTPFNPLQPPLALFFISPNCLKFSHLSVSRYSSLHP